jgi:hypothetical protein
MDSPDFYGHFHPVGLCFGTVLTLLEGNQCFQQALHFEKHDCIQCIATICILKSMTVLPPQFRHESRAGF